MIIPQHIFKNILEYCDDSVERKQRKLWESIKTRHYNDFRKRLKEDEQGYRLIDEKPQRQGYKSRKAGEKFIEVYVPEKEGIWRTEETKRKISYSRKHITYGHNKFLRKAGLNWRSSLYPHDRW